jgi:hypothetical protein
VFPEKLKKHGKLEILLFNIDSKSTQVIVVGYTFHKMGYLNIIDIVTKYYLMEQQQGLKKLSTTI